MKGSQRLRHVDSSTPPMQRGLPDLPMDCTVMVRLLRISVFGMSEFFEPVFRAVDLSENTFHVLCLLTAAEDGTQSPSELSEMVGTSRANMTRILDQLLSDGFISRQTSARDARRQIISITDLGRTKVNEAVPRIAEPLKNAFSGLDKKELAQLNKLLRKAILSFDQNAHAMRAAA